MRREVMIREGSIGRRFVDRYMSEPINFGGEIMTRAQVYEWFEREGYPSRVADYWLIGYGQNARAELGEAGYPDDLPFQNADDAVFDAEEDA